MRWWISDHFYHCNNANWLSFLESRTDKISPAEKGPGSPRFVIWCSYKSFHSTLTQFRGHATVLSAAVGGAKIPDVLGAKSLCSDPFLLRFFSSNSNRKLGCRSFFIDESSFFRLEESSKDNLGISYRLATARAKLQTSFLGARMMKYSDIYFRSCNGLNSLGHMAARSWCVPEMGSRQKMRVHLWIHFCFLMWERGLEEHASQLKREILHSLSSPYIWLKAMKVTI